VTVNWRLASVIALSFLAGLILGYAVGYEAGWMHAPVILL
jgi:hypothetical protein